MLKSESRRHLSVVAEPVERSCHVCIHAFAGMSALYCLAFREEIWHPREAVGCEVYES